MTHQWTYFCCEYLILLCIFFKRFISLTHKLNLFSTYVTDVSFQDSDLKQYWMPDSQCKECYDCHEKFTTFRRRHHCRLCGQIFCSRCCNQEIPGKFMGYTGKAHIKDRLIMNISSHSLILFIFCSEKNKIATKFKFLLICFLLPFFSWTSVCM